MMIYDMFTFNLSNQLQLFAAVFLSFHCLIQSRSIISDSIIGSVCFREHLIEMLFHRSNGENEHHLLYGQAKLNQIQFQYDNIFKN